MNFLEHIIHVENLDLRFEALGFSVGTGYYDIGG